MSVVIDNIEIDREHIEIFEGFLGGGLLLTGKALEDEGKRICDNLKNYKKGDIVQVVDNYKGKYSGIYEIKEISCSVDASKAPAVYNFRVGLQRK